MKFLNKYNEYKQKYTINEGSIKSIINVVQQEVLACDYSWKKYNELSSEQQSEVNEKIQNLLSIYQNRINLITNNKQYQSWLFDMITINNVHLYELLHNDYYVKDLYNILNQFSIICKSPKISQNQKEIFTYKTIDQLILFIKNNKQLLVMKQDINFKEKYTNSTFDIYSIYLKDKKQFQQIYGPDGYNCGWCVTHKNDNYFNKYLNDSGDKQDCYYLWTFKGTTKPYALFHFKSNQFKDIHNLELSLTKLDNNKDDVLDGLYYLISLYDYTERYIGDFESYSDVFKKQMNNIELQKNGGSIGELFAKRYKLIYDKKTNTIDCLTNNKFISISEEYVNDKGSLDFKLTNIGVGNNNIFSDNKLLKTLPEGCTFYDNMITSSYMFQNCTSLEYLPKSLQLSNNVSSCDHMFDGCYSLKEIPNIFSNAINLRVYNFAFIGCANLTEIPTWFKLSEKTQSCIAMFADCVKLQSVPTTFTIPSSIINCSRMFSLDKSLDDKSKTHIQQILKEAEYNIINSHKK